MATGVACLALTHFSLRRGESWAVTASALVALLAEGRNAYGMYRAQSYWGFPVVVLALLYAGLGIAWATPLAPDTTSP